MRTRWHRPSRRETRPYLCGCEGDTGHGEYWHCRKAATCHLPRPHREFRFTVDGKPEHLVITETINLCHECGIHYVKRGYGVRQGVAVDPITSLPLHRRLWLEAYVEQGTHHSRLGSPDGEGDSVGEGVGAADRLHPTAAHPAQGKATLDSQGTPQQERRPVRVRRLLPPRSSLLGDVHPAGGDHRRLPGVRVHREGE